MKWRGVDLIDDSKFSRRTADALLTSKRVGIGFLRAVRRSVEMRRFAVERLEDNYVGYVRIGSSSKI